MIADLLPARFVENERRIVAILLGEDERDQKQVERAVGTLAQLFESQRRLSVAREDLVRDHVNAPDIALHRIGHRTSQDGRGHAHDRPPSGVLKIIPHRSRQLIPTSRLILPAIMRRRSSILSFKWRWACLTIFSISHSIGLNGWSEP